MKKVIWVVLVLIGLVGTLFGMMMVASETGEVVVARYPAGAAGSEVRLWVVDLDGTQYVRAGDEQSGWYAPLTQAAVIEVERGARSARYRPQPEPEVADRIQELMLAKYGWRERYIAWMVGGREGAVPIALMPVK